MLNIFVWVSIKFFFFLKKKKALNKKISLYVIVNIKMKRREKDGRKKIKLLAKKW